MKKSNKLLPELRERAVRMVQEHRGILPPCIWVATRTLVQRVGKHVQIEPPCVRVAICPKPYRLALIRW